jgi:hypothetical protein
LRKGIGGFVRGDADADPVSALASAGKAPATRRNPPTGRRDRGLHRIEAAGKDLIRTVGIDQALGLEGKGCQIDVG